MNSIKIIGLAVIGMAFILIPAKAQSQQEIADSLPQKDIHIRARQLAIPTSFILCGAWGVSNGWFCSVKENVKDDFQRLRGNCRFRVDDQLQYIPVAGNLGLGMIGAKPRHPMRERIAATATAYTVMGIMVNTVKFMVNEKRPDSGALNSFPSGHTATAFMGAELVREEYGNIYGAGAYVFASGIAFLRLYNDRHWLNDIIAGAGVGILSARIGHWLLPVERRWFGWNKSETTFTVIPSYDPTMHSTSLSVVYQF